MLPVVVLSVFVSPAPAQTITLKSGQKVETLGMRRDGAIIMSKVQVGTGSGEVGYPVAQIARIDFPEPAALKTATDLLNQRQLEKALAVIDPVVAYYNSFKEVPGSFWAQSALLKVSILAALKRDTAADTLASEIERAVTDPEVGRAVRVRLSAGLVRKREFEKTIEICDKAITESTDPEVLANAWLNKGEAYAGKKEWDTALMAYLRVPIFYSDAKAFLPPAMLGSARAYWRLDDAARAKKAFNDLIAAYPQSAEAAAAQTELKKIQTP